MTDQEIQRILSTNPPSYKEVYEPKVYLPDPRYLFDISELTNLRYAGDHIDYRFFRNPTFRNWNSKITHNSLGEAVGKNLKSFVIGGYYLSANGIIVEILPTQSSAITRVSREKVAELDQETDPDKAQVLRQKLTQELCDHYSRKIIVTGKDFQARFSDTVKKDAVVIASRKDGYVANVVKDGHLTEAVVIKSNPNGINYRVVYEHT